MILYLLFYVIYFNYRSVEAMHMLQQNLYNENNRYIKWTKKNIDLQLDFDEFEIEANEELLKQVWINLIDNAVKFVPRCGTVELEVADIGDRLCVKISNTGSEIPPEKHEKIFNKFYQADESHATQGNGIGLAIVKRIVELHNGDVCVSSGNGMTAFTVTLPKRQ